MHLGLLDIQIEQLLSQLENCSQAKDSETLEPSTIVATTTTTFEEETRRELQTPLFPNMETLYLHVYDDQGTELIWLTHCPSLRSLHLFVPTRGCFDRTVPTKAALPLSGFLALPIWSTTLTRLKISSGAVDYTLEIPTIGAQESNVRVLHEFKQSLHRLNMTKRAAFIWVMQTVLGSAVGLEMLSISMFEVSRPAMGVDLAREMSSFGAVERKWACTRLKSLRITCLEWCSNPDVNTDLLTQWARLKELEYLDIMLMSCKSGSTNLLNSFPIETPWNLEPCEEPLPWMTEMWPKLTRCKSGGWKWD